MTTLMPDLTQTIILCVEDEQDLREILVEELEDAGYVVTQANNGIDALVQINKLRPDLILCDIVMPEMDGYELLQVIRETMPELSDVPFVFLTAKDGSNEITQGKYAGADDYLVKPINFDLMLATISARIRQVSRMRTQTKNLNLAAHHTRHKGLHHITRMFDLIPSGVVLLDRFGDVKFANLAAQRLADECSIPALTEMLNGTNAYRVRPSYLIIQNAINAGLQAKEYIEFMSIPRADQQRDLLVTICTLADTTFANDELIVALFISGTSTSEPAPLKALEALFKLTPTEGRVAWAFSQGLRPDEIASAFDISIATVAFHKRNIFQKTHTNRQSDLIALLLTLPVCLDSNLA